MIPPAAQATFDANPAFAKVWQFTTAELLNADGSRKVDGRREREMDDERQQGRKRTRRKPWRETNADEGERRSYGVHGGDGDEDGLDDEDEYEEQEDDRSDETGDGAGAGDGDDEIGSDSKGRSRKQPDLKVQLHAVRLRWAKTEVLRQVLAGTAYHGQSHNDSHGQRQGHGHGAANDNHDQEMPAEQRDMLLLMSEYLRVHTSVKGQRSVTSEGALSAEDQHLLSADFDRFNENMHTIAASVGARLVTLEKQLREVAALADPDTDPNTDTTTTTTINSNMNHDDTLFSTLTRQTTHLNSHLPAKLAKSLTTLTSTLSTFLRLQRTLLEFQIPHLESSKHGILSRHAQSKAAFMAAVARAMDLKTRVLVLEARARLDDLNGGRAAYWKIKGAELQKEEARLDARMEVLKGVVDEFESVDPGLGVMARLGTRYACIERDGEVVQRDIRGLEGRRRGQGV